MSVLLPVIVNCPATKLMPGTRRAVLTINRSKKISGRSVNDLISAIRMISELKYLSMLFGVFVLECILGSNSIPRFYRNDPIPVVPFGISPVA